jgi:hypothetical protein
MNKTSIPFQASIIGLETIHLPSRRRRTGEFDFLHNMATGLNPGQAIRLVAPNKRVRDGVVKVWMRIKGKGIPRTTVVKHGVDQFLVYCWLEMAEVEPPNCVSYLARVTLIRKMRDGETNDRVH